MEGVINSWWLHALAPAGTTLLICLLVEDCGNPAELQKRWTWKWELQFYFTLTSLKGIHTSALAKILKKAIDS